MAKNKISCSRHLHLPRNKWENDSKKKKNIPQSSPMPLATPPKDDSEDNSGSEGETDSATDSETDAKMSKETPATLSLDKKNKKRQTEGNTTSVAEDDFKLAKLNSGASSTKAKMFERIWSEEDEILLLEGKINFAKDLGKDASENEFYDFVKDSLSIKNVGQISTKLRNLKRRFKGHDESSFSKSHDKRCCELAKKIWPIDQSVVKKSTRRKTKVEEAIDKWFEKSYLVSGFETVGLLSANTIKEKWEKVSLKTKKMVHERAKLVEVKEFECSNDKIRLFNDLSSIFTEQN